MVTEQSGMLGSVAHRFNRRDGSDGHRAKRHAWQRRSSLQQEGWQRRYWKQSGTLGSVSRALAPCGESLLTILLMYYEE